MKNTIKIIIKVVFLTSLIYETYANTVPLTKQYDIEKTTTAQSIFLKQTNQNKTISDLVKEQAEAIKKIVSAQRPSQIDYPTVTRKEPDIKIKEEKEKESIEQLRLKCQHLFNKLMNNKKDAVTATDKTTSVLPSTTTNFATILPFGPAIKPEFLKNKTKSTTTTQRIEENGYFFESSTSQQELNNDNMAMESTQPKPTVLKPFNGDYLNVNNNEELLYPYPTNDQATKYIKLEPVILQRMLVSNGKNYFYWYRTAPNYVKYTEPYSSYIPLQNSQYVSNSHSIQEHNTKLSLKIATTTPRSNLIITTEKTTSTTPPTTATTTTLVATTTQQQSLPDNSYKHEFKFVVPYSFNGKQTLYQSQQFDPYAYYPKYLQPNTMNVQVPYSPTFHMIKTLSIPKVEENLPYSDEQKLP